MNVAFFLTPKIDVVCLSSASTVRQALEKMEHHRYSAVPLLDHEGRYVGTLTEGDLLWWLRHAPEPWLTWAESTSVTKVARRVAGRAVHINAEMEQLVSLAVEQNFVPVVDDRDVFVGIVRRKLIIEYCAKFLGLAARERTSGAYRDRSGD